MFCYHDLCYYCDCISMTASVDALCDFTRILYQSFRRLLKCIDLRKSSDILFTPLFTHWPPSVALNRTVLDTILKVLGKIKRHLISSAADLVLKSVGFSQLVGLYSRVVEPRSSRKPARASYLHDVHVPHRDSPDSVSCSTGLFLIIHITWQPSHDLMILIL